MATTKKERDLENTKRSWEGKPRLGEESAGGFRGFINYDLSDAQKAAFPDWIESQDFGDVLGWYVADGCILSVKMDAKSNAFMASATQKRVGSPNTGLAVTARAAKPLLALERLLYILALLGDDWEKTQPVANPDRW